MTSRTTPYPAPEMYRTVPPVQVRRLFAFRADHPYRQVATNGTLWSYLACGRGEKALLFLPGAFLKADMWFNQILALEDDYRIIAPDAFALQGLFDIGAVCDALVRSLDAEDIEKATVIGISAGGGVAQVLLQAHPQRVEHVVFSHCGVLEHSPEGERQARRIIRLLRILPLFVVRRLVKRMTTGERPRASQWIAFHDAYLREAVPNVERSMFVGFLRSGLEARRAFTFDPQALESWPGSILILSSEDDALSRDAVGKLQERYPKARTELLPEGGHHAFLFFPDAYTTALTRFLNVAP
ncbi:MAG: alpha/beta hydrolase [Anaerolineae bacterium]